MKREMPITLDKKRNLRYTFASISLIEDYLDKPFTSINFEMLRMRELMALLWGGLIHEEPNLTVDDVFEIMDAIDLTPEEVGVEIIKAVNNSVTAGNKAGKK